MTPEKAAKGTELMTQVATAEKQLRALKEHGPAHALEYFKHDISKFTRHAVICLIQLDLTEKLAALQKELNDL